MVTTSPRAVNEKLVSRIWSSRLFGGQRLLTDRGQELQVVYPGRPCRDHGPDFRDAILAFDNHLRRGDVEVHSLKGDWQVHGHHRDARYDAVILHVVFDCDTRSATTRVDGQPIPTLAVGPLLALSPFEIEGYLDAHQENFPCPWARRDSPESTREFVEWAGDERLRSRAALVEGALCAAEPAQVFYELVFEALGYSRNKLPFRELATIVSFPLLENVAAAAPPSSRRKAMLGLLLGAAGLLPSQRPSKTGADDRGGEYVRRLESHWAELSDYLGGLRVTRPWVFSRVRPENFPTRRVVAASELLASCASFGLVETFLGVFKSSCSEGLPAALNRLLCIRASDEYWRRRFDFGGREDGRESLLIGQERAAVLAVDAVLPFVLALGRHMSEDALIVRAIETYRRLPSPGGNELTRYVAGQLGARSQKLPLRSARFQQGLLHIYHRWCIGKNCLDCLAR